MTQYDCLLCFRWIARAEIMTPAGVLTTGAEWTALAGWDWEHDVCTQLCVSLPSSVIAAGPIIIR